MRMRSRPMSSRIGGVVDDVVWRDRPAIPQPAGPVVRRAAAGRVVFVQVRQDDRTLPAFSGFPDRLVPVIQRRDHAIAIGIHQQIRRRDRYVQSEQTT
jgi:hypothetical protein